MCQNNQIMQQPRQYCLLQRDSKKVLRFDTLAHVGPPHGILFLSFLTYHDAFPLAATLPVNPNGPQFRETIHQFDWNREASKLLLHGGHYPLVQHEGTTDLMRVLNGIQTSTEHECFQDSVHDSEDSEYDFYVRRDNQFALIRQVFDIFWRPLTEQASHLVAAHGGIDVLLLVLERALTWEKNGPWAAIALSRLALDELLDIALYPVTCTAVRVAGAAATISKCLHKYLTHHHGVAVELVRMVQHVGVAILLTLQDPSADMTLFGRRHILPTDMYTDTSVTAVMVPGEGLDPHFPPSPTAVAKTAVTVLRAHHFVPHDIVATSNSSPGPVGYLTSTAVEISWRDA
jgi:hypothetical protein